MTTTLEDLLRGCALERGTIQLTRLPSGWAATIAHHPVGRMVSTAPTGWHADPVDALRAALIEDERQARDLERRYAEAPRAATPVEDWELA